MNVDIMLDHNRTKNLPKFADLVITANEMLAENVYQITLKSEEPLKPYLPGQFAMLRSKGKNGSLLPRPFSVYWATEDTLQFLYKVYGKGTLHLSKSSVGDRVGVLGPLGNSFFASNADVIMLIAGGLGIAPFPYLVHSFFKDREIILFLGNPNKSQIVLVDVLEKMNVNLMYATDDGSFGCKGFVTDLLEDYFKRQNNDSSIEAYICGPKDMERKAVEILTTHKKISQVAMEEAMACGMGVCMGCVVLCKLHQSDSVSYRRVCIEGPVFYGDEIDWGRT